MTRCDEFYAKCERDGNFCGMDRTNYVRVVAYIAFCKENNVPFGTLTDRAARKLITESDEEVKVLGIEWVVAQILDDVIPTEADIKDFLGNKHADKERKRNEEAKKRRYEEAEKKRKEDIEEEEKRHEEAEKKRKEDKEEEEKRHEEAEKKRKDKEVEDERRYEEAKAKEDIEEEEYLGTPEGEPEVFESNIDEEAEKKAKEDIEEEEKRHEEAEKKAKEDIEEEEKRHEEAEKKRKEDKEEEEKRHEEAEKKRKDKEVEDERRYEEAKAQRDTKRILKAMMKALVTRVKRALKDGAPRDDVQKLCGQLFFEAATPAGGCSMPESSVTKGGAITTNLGGK